jgi:hypothetical protein
MFSIVSGNLLLARSNSRDRNYIGFWYSFGTARFESPRGEHPTAQVVCPISLLRCAGSLRLGLRRHLRLSTGGRRGSCTQRGASLILEARLRVRARRTRLQCEANATASIVIHSSPPIHEIQRACRAIVLMRSSLRTREKADTAFQRSTTSWPFMPRCPSPQT